MSLSSTPASLSGEFQRHLYTVLNVIGQGAVASGVLDMVLKGIWRNLEPHTPGGVASAETTSPGF